MWDIIKAEKFMEKAGTFGSVLGLSNIRNLMQELGNIQDELPIVHVAGTNGKGSTCAMLELAFRMSGYRTGRYSSPAVFCPEEKYQINGTSIDKEAFAFLLEDIARACERITERGLPHPTLFEIETAAAFLWFYRQKCQIVILETGLGGAMDATNIIRKPLCSIITSVSMDHMAFLGDTLPKIAEQKAGIIKEGCPVITAGQQQQVYEVFERICREKNAELLIADRSGMDHVRYEDGYLVFDWEEYQNLKLSLLGACQPKNAVCVVKAIQRLNGLGFCVGDDTVRVALKNTVWPGRFEIISRSPLVVIDGAHNEDAAEELRKTLEMGFTNRKIIYIIGVLADKEHEKMLQCMLPLAEKVYTVTPKNPRALSGEVLCREAMKYHDHVEYPGSIRKALEKALADAEGMKESGQPESPMILAFGSLSYLGELKREFMEKRERDEMSYGR